MKFWPFLSVYQKIEQLFYFPFVQASLPGDVHELSDECFCACHLQALKKVPRVKSGIFWFSWTDSNDSTTIQ